MPKSHVRLICKGKCILSENAYHEKLQIVASKIANACGRHVLPSWRNSLGADGIELVDPDLHGTLCISIQPPYVCRERLTDVYEAVKTVLLEEQLDFNGVTPELEILLRIAVVSQDFKLLETTLDKFKHVTLPLCLTASLLRKCISNFNDKAVGILLEHGASADIGVLCEFYDRPLSRATNLFVSHDFERGASLTLRSTMPELTSEEHTQRQSLMTQQRVESLTNIIELLIKHGADLLAQTLDVSTGDIALHRLPWIVVRSPAAARFIVESTPREGLLNCNGVMFAFDVPKYSALSVSLQVALHLYSRNSTEFRQRAARVLQHAVLPLLRAGAALSPDPFTETSLLRSYVHFFRSTREDDAACCEIWGRPEVPTQYLLEIRGQSSLSFYKFMKVLMSRDWHPNSETERMAYRDFATLIRAQYPRRLQAICRLNILKHLPVGVKARKDAINALDLPLFLTNYLNFFDLEPFIN